LVAGDSLISHLTIDPEGWQNIPKSEYAGLFNTAELTEKGATQ